MKTLSIKEAADKAKVSPITIRRAIKSGELKAEMQPGTFGDEYRIEYSSFEEWNRKRMGFGYKQDNTHDYTSEHSDQGLVPAPLFFDLQQQHKEVVYLYGAAKSKADMLEQDKQQLIEENRRLKEIAIEAAKKEGELERLREERDRYIARVEEMENKLAEMQETKGQLDAVTSERDFLRDRWAVIELEKNKKKGIFSRIFNKE